ncbi:type II toxin-antitoxin system prevent-host-death family antitoxin [Mycobacterium sp.]|uniref:type II toxin-antitoxin system prevent-host-death family antitoxin n=1 Tax=Mycobacterium sp. TaxID=1785 RepID=UPI003D6B36C6
MSILVPISKARARLSELVRRSRDDDVVLMNHSTPAAVIVSADRYESLLEEIEDLKDRLSVHERTGVTISAEKLAAELGLNS